MQLRIRQFRRFRENHIQVDRTSQEEQAKDTKREPKVANTVDDKGFHRRSPRRWFLKVETDQQI